MPYDVAAWVKSDSQEGGGKIGRSDRCYLTVAIHGEAAKESINTRLERFTPDQGQVQVKFGDKGLFPSSCQLMLAAEVEKATFESGVCNIGKLIGRTPVRPCPKQCIGRAELLYPDFQLAGAPERLRSDCVPVAKGVAREDVIDRAWQPGAENSVPHHGAAILVAGQVHAKAAGVGALPADEQIIAVGSHGIPRHPAGSRFVDQLLLIGWTEVVLRRQPIGQKSEEQGKGDSHFRSG